MQVFLQRFPSTFYLNLCAGNPHLAPILMTACEPKIENNGRLYQDTVIGALLSLSVLPKAMTGIHEFFDNPTEQVWANLAS